MLLLDFCNIKEWTCSAVLDLYKKHRIVHSVWGARDGFEKYCVSKYQPETPLVFALVKATEIEPWLSEDNEIMSPSKWLGVPILFPSDPGHPQIWRNLQFSKEEFYVPFLDKCAGGTLDLDFVNDQLEDFQEIGFSLAFSVQEKDDWGLKTGIVWNFKTKYLTTIEDYISWEILSLFLNKEAGILKRVHKCEWPECGTYFMKKRKDQKYCSDSCSSNMRSARWRKTGKATEYMRDYMRQNRDKYI